MAIIISFKYFYPFFLSNKIAQAHQKNTKTNSNIPILHNILYSTLQLLGSISPNEANVPINPKSEKLQVVQPHANFVIYFLLSHAFFILSSPQNHKEIKNLLLPK